MAESVKVKLPADPARQPSMELPELSDEAEAGLAGEADELSGVWLDGDELDGELLCGMVLLGLALDGEVPVLLGCELCGLLAPGVVGCDEPLCATIHTDDNNTIAVIR